MKNRRWEYKSYKKKKNLQKACINLWLVVAYCAWHHVAI